MEPGTITAALAGTVLGGVLDPGRILAERQQQIRQASAPVAPPGSQAAKTPTTAVFARQNQPEGVMSGSPGSTLLTANGLGDGTLGNTKLLGS